MIQSSSWALCISLMSLLAKTRSDVSASVTLTCGTGHTSTFVPAGKQHRSRRLIDRIAQPFPVSVIRLCSVVQLRDSTGQSLRRDSEIQLFFNDRCDIFTPSYFTMVRNPAADPRSAMSPPLNWRMEIGEQIE